MEAPLFTVLIDVYNYGRFIEEAVSSVLSQDFPSQEREILVVNDGSTDDTAARLGKFLPRIRYLYQKNGGQASALNIGIRHAKGQFVAFLDADDVWLPGKLKALHVLIQAQPDVGLVYHPGRYWDGKNDLGPDNCFVPVSGIVPRSRSALLQYPMIGTSCLAFRRSILEKLLPIPEVLRSQADAFLTALVIFLAPVAALDEPLACYRVHGQNLFHEIPGSDSCQKIEHRIAMRSALLSAIQEWLRSQRHDLNSRDIRDYLAQWSFAQERDSFLLGPPSRWRYFRHLLNLSSTYAEIMSPRHRIHSCLRALAAFIFGYQRLPLADEAWNSSKQLLGKLRFRPAKSDEN